MKVAISASGKDMNSRLDPRFGRCANFVLIDTDTMNVEAFDNESISLSGGAGIQSAQFLANKGVNAVITGNCGPNAINTLSAAGIKLYTGQAGTIQDVFNKFQQGMLTPTDNASVDSHYGMGGGGGGRGMGRGRGGGGGRGQGGGGGGGQGGGGGGRGGGMGA